DPRRLYNATSARKTVSGDDYWVTHAIGRARVRGVGPPHTDWDYSEALGEASLPVVSHETGQRPVFPDFGALRAKFTGPLKPYNLSRLERVLDANGQAERAGDFRRASARFQYVQYKAEHEALLRSAGSAGYQLLMLTDFTGQSEAFVGILDPFRHEKGFISREEVRQWNSPTVLLARFPSYVWRAGARFSAKVEMAHFGPADLDGVEAEWRLETTSGNVVAAGRLTPAAVSAGGRTGLGEITAPLDGVAAPAALTLRVTAGSVTNQWPIWVYPPEGGQPDQGEIVITRTFDEAARGSLAQGKSVLLLAGGLTNNSAAQTRYESVYWSAGWWGNEFSSLGVVCDPAHPALADFPNAGHSDWQWHELTGKATTFLLEDAPQGFRPIVQLVPDYHFNRLLGQVFEAQVGWGRLLVCGYDLSTDLDKRLAAAQMRRSLLQYMNSPRFQPVHELSITYLTRLLR
ncbi:MAG: beta-galactosidase, partial [bacterium]|nr:beta-galactosidase [bacterium]